MPATQSRPKVLITTSLAQIMQLNSMCAAVPALPVPVLGLLNGSSAPGRWSGSLAVWVLGSSNTPLYLLLASWEQAWLSVSTRKVRTTVQSMIRNGCVGNQAARPRLLKVECMLFETLTQANRQRTSTRAFEVTQYRPLCRVCVCSCFFVAFLTRSVIDPTTGLLTSHL
jgi:hypothetical protein